MKILSIKKIKALNIYCSTWQSLQNMDKKYFEQFDCVMVDEAHSCTAAVLKSILEKCETTKYRFGFTGSLDGTKCHQTVLEGLTGPLFQATTTKKLIEQNKASELSIKCIILNYPEQLRVDNKKFKYADEMLFIANYNKRTQFIANLANQIQDENTLILTAYREHLTFIEQEVKLLCPNKEVLIVHGGIPVEERERVREYAENNNNVIIIATFGTYSTGVNIKNLQNIIFATSYKSQIKVLQSIGRGLRKDGKNNKLRVFDIIDDFSYKLKKNYTYQHFFERIKIYLNQQFKYSIKTINIG